MEIRDWGRQYNKCKLVVGQHHDAYLRSMLAVRRVRYILGIVVVQYRVPSRGGGARRGRGAEGRPAVAAAAEGGAERRPKAPAPGTTAPAEAPWATTQAPNAATQERAEHGFEGVGWLGRPLGAGAQELLVLDSVRSVEHRDELGFCVNHLVDFLLTNGCQGFYWGFLIAEGS